MKNSVLFVDDEKEILRSIQRNFRKKNYDVYIIETAKEALELLEEKSIDIVVSDALMSRMNGLEFLEKVKKKHPDIHRMILSGYVDRDEILNAILTGVCFDYITKPWKQDDLECKIEEVFNVRRKLQAPEIKALINQIDHLPAMPEILTRFDEALSQNRSISEIAQIIKEDIAISTKVLQLANSIAYSIKRVETLEKAITIIGLNTLKNLLVTSFFISNPDLTVWQKKEMRYFTQEINKFNICYGLLYHYKFKKHLEQKYMTFGIAFNIGKIILLSYFPNRYVEIRKKSKKDNISFHSAEIALGYINQTSREIGAYFLDLWNFSNDIIKTILHIDTGNEVDSESEIKIKIAQLTYGYMRKMPPEHFEQVKEMKEIQWEAVESEKYKEIKKLLDEMNVK